MGDLRGGSLLDELAGRVVASEIDPYVAADELLASLRH
jgi:LAO/AO transport system kinase